MNTLSRRAFLLGLGLLPIGGLLASCGGAPSASAATEARSEKSRQDATAVSAENVQAFAAGHNAFALDLYAQLRATPGNLFFSPYSIAQVLTMASAGARGNTATQMAQTLHSAFAQEQLHPAANALDQALMGRGKGEDGFKLAITNAIWGQRDQQFQPAFLDTLAANYGAGMQLMNFKDEPEQSRQAINAAIAKQTEGKITDLIPTRGVTGLTRLVLTNAIYFNAKWVAPFTKEATQDGPFTTDKGEQVTVPLMHRKGFYAYGKGVGYQVLQLPYRGGVSMLVLLPDQGQFDAVEKALTLDTLNNSVSALKSQEVILTLPKFEHHSASISLKDMLVALGMRDAFDASAADFSGMDGTRSLYISDGVHKAMVRVDEEGTEAAAATAIGMAGSAMPVNPPVEFLVDRPFIFAIRDDATGALLFAGRMLNPKT